ncbi:hypothetical protein BRD06_07390 [Halobacteriales archaeon QS_9_67_15]|nr:MAG: hypothetical protein BRD06_07390 [Halobacteriales archaeon QS_9_67_15]
MRVLADGGRLALSDVVVSEDAPEVPDRLARALCLTGARNRAELTVAVERTGFTVEERRDHREDLLAMRDRVGERGETALAAVEALETAVDDGRIGYVSVVADA